jgi:hypothetical protein
VKDLGENQDLCKKLSSTFHIPSFFWTETAYKANGFFGSRDDPIPGFEGQSHCMSARRSLRQVKTLRTIGSFSRFLIKELQSPPKEYDWQYLAFHSLWFAQSAQATPATQVVLCFDLSDQMKRLVSDNFQTSNPESIGRCPFAVYETIIETVMMYYDKALWEFREPVRNIEKVRRTTSPYYSFYCTETVHNQ